MKLMKKRITEFQKICEITNYNIFIVNRYLKFLYNYDKFMKSNKVFSHNKEKSDTSRIIQILDQKVIIEQIYKIVKVLIEQYKKQMKPYIREEIKRGCIWTANVLYEYISFTKSDDNEELQKYEYTV